MIDIYTLRVEQQGGKYKVVDRKKLCSLDAELATKIYEKSVKHPHVGKNVVWTCVEYENFLQVPPRTYLQVEMQP